MPREKANRDLGVVLAIRKDKTEAAASCKKKSDAGSTVSWHVAHEVGTPELRSILESNNLPEKAVDDGAIEDTPLEPFDPRTERTIFIGNVPVSTKSQVIKRLASAYGNVESVRFRNIVPEGPRISKRAALHSRRLHKAVDVLSAYVVFSDPNGTVAVEKACSALNMTIFKGNHLRVTPASATETCPRRSVFVGNLPFDVSEEALLAPFLTLAAGCDSKIICARVARHRETGIGRGFGFITFEDELGVRFCLSQAEKIRVAGRSVRVTVADKTKMSSTKSFKNRFKEQYLKRKKRRFKRKYD